MTHLEQDASDLALLFHFVLPTAIHSAIFLLASLAAMLLLNWQLALVAILPFPILYFVLSRIEPEVRSYYNRMFRAEADLRVAASDSLVGARVIRAFGQEQQELDRFDKPNRSAARLGFLADATAGTARPPMELVTELVLVCVWAGGAWALVHDQVSIGLLITFAGYLGRFFGPVGSLIELVQYWARASTGANRLFNLIDTGVRNERPNPQSDDSRIRGEIGLEGVSFSYTAGQPVLLSVDLRAAPGEMIGVVGHTGAGKSTLINLLARLYSPDEGVIRIDGRDIRDLDSASLRGQIGVVLQDTYLFLGSVRDNIAYARPDASLEEVMAAATAADAHDFIVRMPDGYDTVLGPRGIGLSGGQRQRLGIARALLLDPPLLLMDEATSSVDTETELRIQRAIERLVENRTTVIIAHRLSTLRLTSRLYVLDHGRVAETGTHSELIQAGGPYQQLVERQRRALHVIGVGE